MPRLVTLRWAPLLALLAALPSHAQYKVVGPDGKVTYTDRQPASTDGKVVPLTARAGSGPVNPDAALPLEVRQAASRYPVTLYTITGTCEPCGAARQLLRQRGIPYAEKQVLSAEDTEALERLSGGRDVPALGIGAQTLRGFTAEVWASYLDAAGYPRDSRLPSGYVYAAPTPIVARAIRPVDAPAAAAPDTPAPAAANPTGIKF